MSSLFDPVTFPHGGQMTNRFMLAPLTNQQSHPDGTLSGQEHDWLVMRAKGGFGAVMTAAAFVQPDGKGFDGQLGIHDDVCNPGLERLARSIKANGSLALVQLYHCGRRGMAKLTGKPLVAPSDDQETGARAMTVAEIEAMIENFIAAAQRAQRTGFDGAEIHGAHGYLLCAFLSPTFNRRTDEYGGSLGNRTRPLRAVVDGIRDRCGPEFNLGLRLSPERVHVEMAEMLDFTGELLAQGKLDFLDMSLWDVFKEPEDAAFKGKSLMDCFSELERGKTRLGAAGNIRSARDAEACLAAGVDFVAIGRAAIAAHDFPRRVRDEEAYTMPALPLSPDHLEAEGVSPPFMEYLRTFDRFVAGE